MWIQTDYTFRSSLFKRTFPSMFSLFKSFNVYTGGFLGTNESTMNISSVQLGVYPFENIPFNLDIRT